MRTGSSTGIALRSNEAHIWTAALDQPQQCLEDLERTLSSDERRRADRYRFQRDRHHFIAGRGFLRILIARYLKVQPQILEFRYGGAGKPALAEIAGSADLRFNCSHSQGLALYAVAHHRRIGVDIEALRCLPDVVRIARHCFSARENAMLDLLEPDRQREGFFNGWTRKEAYVKAVGDGLTMPLHRIEVSLVPGKPSALLSIDGDPKAASRWTLEAVSAGFGYVAAIAVEGHDHRLAYQGRIVP